MLVKDINPGAGSSSPSELFYVNRTLFFRAFHPSTGTELWKSDGTAGGTVLVADFNAGPTSTGLNGLIDFKDAIFFTIFRVDTGYELWSIDGTGAGPMLVKGFGSRAAVSEVVIDNVLFLQDGRGLWRSDGTSVGTTLIRDSILSGASPCGGSFTAVNGILVFPGRDARGCELWWSHGITADLLTDIYPGPPSSMWQYSTGPFTPINDLVLFGADDGVNGLELWATDGTSTTRMVQNIAEGAAWSTPLSFTPVGRLVFFSADSDSGRELWAISRSDLHRAFNRPRDDDNDDGQDDKTSRRDSRRSRGRSSSDEFRAFVATPEDGVPAVAAPERTTR